MGSAVEVGLACILGNCEKLLICLCWLCRWVCSHMLALTQYTYTRLRVPTSRVQPIPSRVAQLLPRHPPTDSARATACVGSATSRHDERGAWPSPRTHLASVATGDPVPVPFPVSRSGVPVPVPRWSSWASGCCARALRWCAG